LPNGQWYTWRTEAGQQEVWSAYLSPNAGTQATVPPIVIQDRTEPGNHSFAVALLWPVALASSERPLPSVETGTHVRWMLARLCPHPIRRLRLLRPGRLAHSPWTERVGYVRLSSVGFNSDQAQALFYVVGPYCGNGDYVLMRKVNGHWVVESPSWGFRRSWTLVPGGAEQHSGMTRTPSEGSDAGTSIVQKVLGRDARRFGFGGRVGVLAGGVGARGAPGERVGVVRPRGIRGGLPLRTLRDAKFGRTARSGFYDDLYVVP
jgi:hypothetical protein